MGPAEILGIEKTGQEDGSMGHIKHFEAHATIGQSTSARGPHEGPDEFAVAVHKLSAAIDRDAPSGNTGSKGTWPHALGAQADRAELPESDARYRVLVEQIPAVIFMVFLEGGASEAYVSPQIEEMLGFTQEEWLEDPVRWYRQIHPEDRSRWSAEVAETLSSGKPLKSIYRVLARDGHVVWFHCEAKLVRKRDEEPWFIHGVGFDITDLKTAEEALRRDSVERERSREQELERQIAQARQNESRLAAIVESSEDAILSKNLHGLITSWNAAATRLFGYQPEEILGKSILLLVPEELHPQEATILEDLRANKRITHLETQRLTKSGARIEVAMTVSPIRDAVGRVIGGSTIARDITELKQRDQRLRISEKLAATGRLAATISHEINNPLEAVTNLIFLAKNEPSLPEKTQRLLQEADRELQRVVHIARHTLGFYRETSVPAKIDVPELLADVLEIYRRKMANKNLNAITRYGPHCELVGLPGEIRQVFSNLVANAIDASAAGGTIILKAARSRNWKNGQGWGIRVSIADRGTGIPTPIRRRIFEPFYSTKQNLGTGLGLWVSKSLVEKAGGSMRVRSSVEPGRSGAVFSVFLPCEPLDRAQPREELKSEAA